MSEDRLLRLEAELSRSVRTCPRAWRFQTGMRAVIALVACCGVVSWAARYLWESQHLGIAVARGLQARAATERLKAIRDLESICLIEDSTIAIPALVPRLADSNAKVRAAAAEALGSIGGNVVKTGSGGNEARAAVAALLESLNDKEAAVRTAAANSLGMIVRCDVTRMIAPELVAPALIRRLDDRDAEVRGAAIGAFGFIGPVLLVDPPSALVSALEDESAKNRVEAVYSLARFTRGLPHVIPSLLRSIQRAQPNVRVSYVQLINQIQPPRFSAEAVPPFIIALGSDDREIRHLAASRLAAFNQDASEAVPVLIKMLREPTTLDRPSRRNDLDNAWFGEPSLAAADALGKIAPGTDRACQAVAALTEVVRSGSPVMRGVAADALRLIGAEAETALPTLITALRETIAGEKLEPELVLDADRMHSQLAGYRIAQALTQIANNMTSPEEIVTVLTESISSKSGATRRGAVEGLRELGPKARSAILRLRAFRKDSDQGVREAATFALERLEKPN
jgi:HEAT repeat protein